MLTDPTAEHDALVVLCSAAFLGFDPGTLPEGRRDIVRGALRRAFEVLGYDVHDERRAREQITAELRVIDARRHGDIASGVTTAKLVRA